MYGIFSNKGVLISRWSYEDNAIRAAGNINNGGNSVTVHTGGKREVLLHEMPVVVSEVCDLHPEQPASTCQCIDFDALAGDLINLLTELDSSVILESEQETQHGSDQNNQDNQEHKTMNTDTNVDTLPEMIQEAPPEGRSRGQVSLWLTALRETPGQWYRFPETVTSPTGTSIRKGKYKGIKEGEYEVRTRSIKDNKRKNLWARYVGDVSIVNALTAADPDVDADLASDDSTLVDS